MSVPIPRRTVLQLGGGTVIAASLGWLFQRDVAARPRTLVRDSVGLLDLPSGFSYRVIQRAFDRMSDGFRVPARADGMACFPGANGTWILMRNHELDYVETLGAYARPAPPQAYDANAFGAVTRVVLDPQTLEPLASNLVLTGTLRNCAGGPSPWGWLSCEEAVNPGHGFVFLCPLDQSELAPARKIAGYGRFNHEAVCVDPVSHVAYLTEDRMDGCLYRFLPDSKSAPFSGRLQALAVADRPGYDTSNLATRGHTLAVQWLDVPEPTPAADDARLQARARGAAVFCRGEGIAFHGGSVYVCCTSGGPLGLGQIFQLGRGRTGQEELRLLAAATDERLLDHPDNITLSPWGHVILAEDGYGDQFIRGLTEEGRVYDIARNTHSSGELAGVCFSPDASVLFVNLQMEGVTLGIRGPFRGLSS